MKWTQHEPHYGDIIRVKMKFYHHYGIFVDEHTVVQFGLPNNVEQPADSVKILTSDIHTFLCGGELEVASLSASERLSRRSPEATVTLALSRIGEGGYHILHNNCEHFVNDCVFGKKTSSFVDGLRQGIRDKLGK